MREKLLVVALMVAIAVSFTAYGVWANQPPSHVTNNPSDTDMTKFKAVVNGLRDVNVTVGVDISDGVTEEEAEQIAEATFIQVMGEEVLHQLDTLTFNDTQIKAHYTWGVDKNDMGHVFDMTADLTTLLITATHCF